MRIRGVAESDGEGDHAGRAQAGDRCALDELHECGVRICVILRWAPSDWTKGVRPGGGQRHPLDLREVYERGRRLGAAYGDLVDVWEIENEPDIDFVVENPETHAAFQKAVYLGLKSGVRIAYQAGLSLEFKTGSDSGWLARKQGRSALDLKLPPSARSAPSRVVMAPLALPPGPYLERLWANGLASYTDGFNFHFYGYAEDFTGVYRQFEDAVAKLGAVPPGSVEEEWLRMGSRSELDLGRRTSSDRRVRRTLPVFITEYGYGLLDAEARDSVEGRVRQWRWFATLAKQIRTLRPEGPMAFLLNPYYEAGLNEFGLTMTQPAVMQPENGNLCRTEKPETGNLKPEIDPKSENSGFRSPVSGFTPDAFGERRVQPWMRRIGQKVRGGQASPALAYLWDYADRHPYRARAWAVRAAPPSPVVIDFVAGTDLVQAKRSGGYVLQGVPVEWSPVSVHTGQARLVVYNFGPEPVSGELVLTDPSVVVSALEKAITLAPGERREVALELRMTGDAWTPRTFGVRFLPTVPSVGSAVFALRLYPPADGEEAKPVAGFAFAPEAARARRVVLQARPLAVGEPALRLDGRWLATDGVRVEEREGVWRFHIDHLPAEPLRPASVELPFPAGFVFNPGTALILERRRVESHGEFKLKVDGEVEARASGHSSLDFKLKPSVSAAQLKPRAGAAGDMMDVYFRTENGNLYQTWPRLRMRTAWTEYLGLADDFTMGFFGRAALPWRFAENRPASLVFFLRSSQVPAVFEVRNARIVRLGAGD